MAVTYGFFNSLNGDRKYNADQMSEYFKGLVSDGVYENVGGALQVLTGTGMTVQVQTGRMLIDSKWLENDAVLTVQLNSAHVTLNRYTAIVARLDRTNRLIEIVAKDGTNASSPIKPSIQDDAAIMEKCLAYVYVPASATSISQSDIEDTRANTTICGWVTGIIEQVDTSELFLQWQTAYQEFYAQMQSWMETQQTTFESWLSTLTSELKINTYINQYEKYVKGTTSEIGVVQLDMEGYTYDANDIFIIAINGLMAAEAYDYLIDTSKTPVEVHLNFTTSSTTQNDAQIKVLKSVIGQRPTT